jgi:uncharacterized membrane protein HdeD (DUF308 family)
MNIYFLSAAGMTLILGLIHSFLGEKLIITPLLKLDNLPHILGSDFLMKRTLRFAWHLMSIAVWALGAILVVLALVPLGVTDIFILHIIAATFLVSGIVSLVVAQGRHFSWYSFLFMAGLIWWGLYY